MAKQKHNFMKWGKIAIPVIIIAGMVWYFRPWLHGFFMFFYRNPIVLEFLVVIFLITRIKKIKSGLKMGKFKKGKFDMKEVSASLSFIPVLIILLFVLLPFFSDIMPRVHVVNELNYQAIESLPDTKENIRLMPYEVAYRYSKDSLQLSQYKLGTENIANINGNLSWMFPLVPDGQILEFMLKNKGAVFVDATTQKKNTKVVWKDLQIGEGMQITDNLYWNIYKSMYWIDTDDPFYIHEDGEVYTVVPLISYSYHHWFGLLYSVPRFGGIMIIDSSGEIEFMEPKESMESEILKDNRIFPENLARYYVESYVYNNGVINKWFIHDDQIDIQDISYTNKQPFLMETSDGLKWFISTEPYGQSHGIFKIFLVDARDGEIEKYELPIEETLTGPVKASDFVRRENPIVDWNKFRMVESLPFVTDDELYWKVAIVPNDAAGIAYQAFVNSKTNEVMEFEEDNEIRKFIQEGSLVKKVNETVEENQTTQDRIEQIKNKLEELQKLIDQLE